MSHYRDLRDAIKAVWSTYWPHGIDFPVFWRGNEATVVPDGGAVTHWLEISIAFGEDAIAAFGGGRLKAERDQNGSVVVRVFTEAGYGEDATLDLLSDAVAAFRSRRDGVLSFVGSISGIDEGGTEDGNWYQRAAVIAFSYRHIG
jgi:hypothetical protein